MTSNNATQRILVWDYPTRIFHWSLALSFIGAFITGDSETYRNIHLALGYVFTGLLGFRLIWGLAGTKYARFRSFIFSLTDIKHYVQSLLKRNPEHYIGHNPAGGFAILLLLGLGILIGISGLGLYFDVGGYSLEAAWEESHELTSNMMLLVVLLHIGGVIVSSWLHKENLVASMLSGYKNGAKSSGIQQSHLVVGILLITAMLVTLFMSL